MVEMKILLLVGCKLVLLAHKGQQNGQTNQKSEQNGKSWQIMPTKSEKFIRKVKNIIEPAKQGQQSISVLKRVQLISAG